MPLSQPSPKDVKPAERVYTKQDLARLLARAVTEERNGWKDPSDPKRTLAAGEDELMLRRINGYLSVLHKSLFDNHPLSQKDVAGESRVVTIRKIRAAIVAFDPGLSLPKFLEIE